MSGILTDLCYCVCVVCKQHAAESYKKGPVEVSFVQLSFVQSQNVAVKPATLVLQDSFAKKSRNRLRRYQTKCEYISGCMPGQTYIIIR